MIAATDRALIRLARTAGRVQRRANLDPDDTPALLTELADRLETLCLERSFTSDPTRPAP